MKALFSYEATLGEGRLLTGHMFLTIRGLFLTQAKIMNGCRYIEQKLIEQGHTPTNGIVIRNIRRIWF